MGWRPGHILISCTPETATQVPKGNANRHNCQACTTSGPQGAPMVAIWLRSPHSARKVRVKASSSTCKQASTVGCAVGCAEKTALIGCPAWSGDCGQTAQNSISGVLRVELAVPTNHARRTLCLPATQSDAACPAASEACSTTKIKAHIPEHARHRLCSPATRSGAACLAAGSCHSQRQPQAWATYQQPAGRRDGCRDCSGGCMASTAPHA